MVAAMVTNVNGNYFLGLQATHDILQRGQAEKPEVNALRRSYLCVLHTSIPQADMTTSPLKPREWSCVAYY